MFKNNVCVNLTTQTSKYRVDVSQLSLQLLQLSFEPTFEKIEAHFFSEIVSRDLEKLIFFVWGRNLTKTHLQSFGLLRASF
jgi:hypothetical protein